jgi:hypothetical protein
VQERYLGDSHDFIKYALLRHLAGTGGWRLGVNWYLTDPAAVDGKASQDGEKRHHLKGGHWETLDADLFARIQQFQARTSRKIAKLESSGILPSGTAYFTQFLRAGDRTAWHERAQRALADADLVFLDPDNGLEVKSMSARTAPKYALAAEVADYCRAGKIVVTIQFARQCDPIRKAHDVRERLHRAADAPGALPVIRGRVAPNILFLSLAPRAQAGALREALQSFGSRSPLLAVID